MANHIAPDVYDNDLYTVDDHQYPIDLGSVEGETKYGGHRIIFYINVQGGGAIAKKSPAYDTTDLPPSRYKKHSGDQIKEALGSDIRFLAPKKRLTTAISLYIPETLIKSYNVNWGEVSGDEMMGPEAIAQQLAGAAKMTTGAVAGGFFQAAKAGGGLAAAKILGGMKYAQKASGITPGNSKAELLFQSVEFSSFTFDYKFAPKSEAEAENVLNIIRTFRHHMLPEYFDDQNFLYIYPSEFEIRYYKGVDENQFLEHHMTSVLKAVNINYNPNGQFSTFANGMPTHINLTLQFQELSVPTKETSPYNKSGA